MGEAIAILGGSGSLGSALAARLARAGHEVVVGSRDPAKGRGYAEAAAAAAKIVFLTVPFAQQAAILREVGEALVGKILVDCTVPLVPPKVARVQLPPQGSAAMVAREILGDEARIVSALQNVAADLLGREGEVDCDILVAGDDPADRGDVIRLLESAGLRAYHAGSLANAAAAEALTSILIFLNRHYGGHAGIRITGLEDA
jgi:NADPH-dependent F420 reductase